LERELRPIQIAIYKEKEMVDFRRWITALAVLALFVGLAGAQVPGNGTPSSSLTCAANVAVPPAIRTEGMTELIGDILITCTGGGFLTPGSPLPTVNITVSLGTNVTSRILGSNGASNSSEALLILNEAGASVAAGGTLTPLVTGFGPGAPQTLCNNAAVGAGLNGCTEFANQVNTAGVNSPGGFQVATSTATVSAGTAFTAGPTVFQGLVVGNQVTFNGIPVLPPVSSGVATTYRITNVRANAAGLGGGGLPGTTQLLASISISGSTSLPVTNPVLIAGLLQSGLTVAFQNANNTGGLGSSGTGISQCNSFNQASGTQPNGGSVIQFKENFGTAFKTRVAPTSAYNGQSGTPTQNVPGNIYNSESGFVYPAATGNGWVAGLADYGTRLKAVFNNVPAGVRVFVSTVNIATNTSGPNALTAVPSNTSTSSYAVLVASEAAPDANGFPPVLASTIGVNGNPATLGLTELPVSSGTTTAVWEVINTNPSALEVLQFAIFFQTSANVPNNSPAPGTGTVNLSYAPTPPVPFSATAGSQASGSLTVPRFADTSTARNIVTVSICQTLLLFPYLTYAAGFDTGVAIANTSQDPIGTQTQAGTCTMTFYDGTGKTPNFTTPSIAAGTVYTNTVSALAANGYVGYMFALCNFQYAHGFAFVSDVGARNLAMGYLALVINGTVTTRNNGSPASEGLQN
jgi:hypothetical protein